MSEILTFQGFTLEAQILHLAKGRGAWAREVCTPGLHPTFILTVPLLLLGGVVHRTEENPLSSPLSHLSCWSLCLELLLIGKGKGLFVEFFLNQVCPLTFASVSVGSTLPESHELGTAQPAPPACLVRCVMLWKLLTPFSPSFVELKTTKSGPWRQVFVSFCINFRANFLFKHVYL